MTSEGSCVVDFSSMITFLIQKWFIIKFTRIFLWFFFNIQFNIDMAKYELRRDNQSSTWALENAQKQIPGEKKKMMKRESYLSTQF